MKNSYYLIAFSIIIFSSSLNAQWVQTNGPYDESITDLVVSYSEVGDTSLVAGLFNGDVYRSTNNGASWDLVSVITNSNIATLAVSGTIIFAGTSSGVYRSTDIGNNWVSVDTALANHIICAIVVSGNNIYAGTGSRIDIDGDIFLSTDNGTSWTKVDSSLVGTWISTLAISGTNLFAGTATGYAWPPFGVLLSTNNGMSWTSVNNGLTDTSITILVVSGTNLFAGTSYGGVFRSSNSGTIWMAINSGLTNTRVTNLAICPNGVGGTNLLAATVEGGGQEGSVFLSTDNGESWAPFNTGFPPNTNVSAFAISGTYLFAGTSTFGTSTPTGVWKRPLSDMITGIEDQSTEIPSHFILEQNYPNPFNPSTTIRYAIPEASFVVIKIYDLLGKEVATLVNEEQSAGSYEVEFDAAGLSSGMYFYKLQTENPSTNSGQGFIETKKMILTK